MKGLCGLLVLLCLLCGCQGEEHSWELVDSFSEEKTVFLAVRYENGNWMLGHDT